MSLYQLCPHNDDICIRPSNTRPAHIFQAGAYRAVPRQHILRTTGRRRHVIGTGRGKAGRLCTSGFLKYCRERALLMPLLTRLLRPKADVAQRSRMACGRRDAVDAGFLCGNLAQAWNEGQGSPRMFEAIDTNGWPASSFPLSSSNMISAEAAASSVRNGRDRVEEYPLRSCRA